MFNPTPRVPALGAFPELTGLTISDQRIFWGLLNRGRQEQKAWHWSDLRNRYSKLGCMSLSRLHVVKAIISLLKSIISSQCVFPSPTRRLQPSPAGYGSQSWNYSNPYLNPYMAGAYGNTYGLDPFTLQQQAAATANLSEAPLREELGKPGRKE